jgi:hypothetical protein
MASNLRHVCYLSPRNSPCRSWKGKCMLVGGGLREHQQGSSKSANDNRRFGACSSLVPFQSFAVNQPEFHSVVQSSIWFVLGPLRDAAYIFSSAADSGIVTSRRITRSVKAQKVHTVVKVTTWYLMAVALAINRGVASVRCHLTLPWRSLCMDLQCTRHSL